MRLARLAALAPLVYEDWTMIDLRDRLSDLGITVHKSDGHGTDVPG